MHASIISLEPKFASASYGYGADATSLQNYRIIHMNLFAWRVTHSCSPNICPSVVKRFDGPANSCSAVGKQCDLVFAPSAAGRGLEPWIKRGQIGLISYGIVPMEVEYLPRARGALKSFI